MKIRLSGDLKELSVSIEKLKEVFEVENISKPYKNRNSDDYRIYIEVSDIKQI